MIGSLIIGGFAGFLAGHLMKGSGYGVLGNIVLGILGGLLGGFLFGLVGLITTGLIGDLVAGVVGAVILIAFFSKARKGQKS